MKKFLFFTLILTAIIPTFIFSGCTNENKTLARNLDETIANLVYSVSSLDWADNNSLNKLNTEQTTENVSNTTPQTATISNEENQKDTLQEPFFNKKRHHRFPHKHSHLYEENIENFDTNSNNLKNQNINYQIQNQSLKLDNNQPAQQLNNLAEINFNDNNKLNTFSFSTDNIEKHSSEIQETITTLINKRATILMYINDLYKGNVKLTPEAKTAINAYINIIKDNTSFLNNNKGMITNQMNQANSIIKNNTNSPLVNAYIIRTTEAIQTRLAKLSSSILAIDAICDIIQNNLTETSPNFNHNGNFDNINVNNDINTNNNYILKNKTTNNNNVEENSNVDFVSISNKQEDKNNQLNNNRNISILASKNNTTTQNNTVNNEANTDAERNKFTQILDSNNTTHQTTNQTNDEKNINNCLDCKTTDCENCVIKNDCIDCNNYNLQSCNVDENNCKDCKNNNYSESNDYQDYSINKTKHLTNNETIENTTESISLKKNNIEKREACCKASAFIDKNKKHRNSSQTQPNDFSYKNTGFIYNNKETANTIPYTTQINA